MVMGMRVAGLDTGIYMDSGWKTGVIRSGDFRIFHLS